MGLDLLPVIGGHEAVGVVVALGSEAASLGFDVGDLVGATAWHGACLKCSGCSYGRQYCSNMQVKGISTPGYFAEYSTIDAATAIPMKHVATEGIAPERLAPIFCAGITVWDALERAKIVPGETIAVVGAEGLGQLAIMYAGSLGANIIALDVRDEQLHACTSPGGIGTVRAINTLDLNGPELEERVRALNKGRLLSCIIITTGAIPAYTSSFPLVAPEGRLVAVGVPSEAIPLSSRYLSRHNIRCVVIF
jgi:propanol-preferring alcohol dehydrogenase